MSVLAGKYSEDLQDRYGNGFSNATVAIETLESEAATLYAARDKSSYIPPTGLSSHEVRADAKGNLRFFANPGQYQILVTPTNGSTLPPYPVDVYPDPLEYDTAILSEALPEVLLRSFSTIVGDGVADDSLAIQDVLEAHRGLVVVGHPGDTYLLGIQGTKSYTGSGSGSLGGGLPYCLQIPNRTTLDAKGARLLLPVGVDATMVVNEHQTPTDSPDEKVGFCNAIVDGNGVVLTSKSLMMLNNIDGLRLTNIQVVNTTHLGGQIFDIDNGEFDGVVVDDIQGQGIHFGSNVAGLDVRDSHFGSLVGRNTTEESQPNFPGNPFYLVITRCSVGSITLENHAAGLKIEYGGNCSIGQVICNTGTSGNSGCKVQGNGTTTTPKRMNIGLVQSMNQNGTGLYVEGSEDCTVMSYIGEGNGLLGTWPDVWIAGVGTKVISLQSTGAGQRGVLIRNSAVDYQLGTIRVLNPGSVPGGDSKVAVSVAGGSGLIGNLIARDNRGTPVMTKGFEVSDAGAVGVLGSYLVYGNTGSAVTNAANSNFKMASLVTLA